MKIGNQPSVQSFGRFDGVSYNELSKTGRKVIDSLMNNDEFKKIINSPTINKLIGLNEDTIAWEFRDKKKSLGQITHDTKFGPGNKNIPEIANELIKKAQEFLDTLN